jgi:hypothetical protein
VLDILALLRDGILDLAGWPAGTLASFAFSINPHLYDASILSSVHRKLSYLRQLHLFKQELVAILNKLLVQASYLYVKAGPIHRNARDFLRVFQLEASHLILLELNLGDAFF